MRQFAENKSQIEIAAVKKPMTEPHIATVSAIRQIHPPISIRLPRDIRERLQRPRRHGRNVCKETFFLLPKIQHARREKPAHGSAFQNERRAIFECFHYFRAADCCFTASIAARMAS